MMYVLYFLTSWQYVISSISFFFGAASCFLFLYLLVIYSPKEEEGDEKTKISDPA